MGRLSHKLNMADGRHLGKKAKLLYLSNGLTDFNENATDIIPADPKKCKKIPILKTLNVISLQPFDRL